MGDFAGVSSCDHHSAPQFDSYASVQNDVLNLGAVFPNLCELVGLAPSPPFAGAVNVTYTAAINMQLRAVTVSLDGMTVVFTPTQAGDAAVAAGSYSFASLSHFIGNLEVPSTSCQTSVHRGRLLLDDGLHRSSRSLLAVSAATCMFVDQFCSSITTFIPAVICAAPALEYVPLFCTPPVVLTGYGTAVCSILLATLVACLAAQAAINSNDPVGVAPPGVTVDPITGSLGPPSPFCDQVLHALG